MSLIKLFNVSICILIGFSGFSQKSSNDSIFHLKEIVITANRLENFSAGTKIQTIDSSSVSQQMSSNLSTLLENESPLFIKSYGLGSLATSSFRGGSASHTAILWSGFNINNPMNGQLDLSLIPNSFINNVCIQYGGTSALWGSGAVGGAIHLNNEMKFNKGITVAAGSSFGSFANYGQNIQIDISRLKWITSVKFFNTSAKNNFEYYNKQLIGTSKVRQSNAELKLFGLLEENYFRINDNQKIIIRFWYQHNDRNIPPTMLQTINKSNQKDENYRLTSEWQRVGEKVICLSRVAYFDENLVYSDYIYDYQLFNRSQTIIAEAESKIRLRKNHMLNVGINNTFAQAVSYGYPYKPKQNSIAVFTSYSLNSRHNKFLATLSARQEIMESTFIPFTYSLGSEYTIFKWLSAKGNVSKVYRVPSFNDLFWNPGGNINLLPESGYSEEAGLLVKFMSENSKINFSFEPTVFNRNMDNWILWLPGQSYWSPQNIMKVWSRGMETRSELRIQYKKVKFKISLLTNYIVSTNEKANTENDASVGKQLIYIPMYSGHGKISVEYKGFILSYNQNYTGYRYTSTDNSEYMEPYLLANMYASCKISFNKYTMNLFVQVNNFFNEQYQVILNRAMPLRNYQAGILFQFNKSNNNL